MSRFVTTRRLVNQDLPHTTGRSSGAVLSRMRASSNGRSTRTNIKRNGSRTSSNSVSISRSRAQTSSAIVKGSKNKTGDIIVSNAVGSTQVVEYDGPDSVQINYSTTISRPSRSQGGRRVSTTRVFRRTAATPGQGITQSPGFTQSTEACDEDNLPPEPEEEPLEPDPGPAEPDPEPTNEDQPQPSPQPTQPVGCGPEEPAQWFFNQCPSGTSEIGFADLADGSNMRLCLGPEGRTPTGDGCPVEPDTYGYSPVNGQCTLVPNGLYSTEAACEDSLPEPIDPPADNDGVVPFEGGQCPTTYRVVVLRAAYTNIFGNVVNFVNANPESGGIGPGPLVYESSDKFKRVRSNVDGAIGILANFDITNTPDADTLIFAEFDVVRLDGNPDNCGNADFS